MDQQLLFACDLKGLILFVDSGGTITLNQRHTHTLWLPVQKRLCRE